MKTRIFVLLFLTIGISAYPQSLTMMSYNLRFDNPGDGPDRWDMRKDFLAKQVLFHSPDVMGTQEGLLHQLEYLDSMLTSWKYIGAGRDDGKTAGEYSAVFYNTERLQLLNDDTFWLSETPSKVSTGWDASMERICTWALFKDRLSDQQFYVFNTHFDHIGMLAREKSTELILESINEMNKENFPVVLMGDLNLEPDKTPVKMLSTVMKDSYTEAEIVSFGPGGSFNAFQYGKPAERRIDYIFTDKKTRILKAAILSDARRLHYPSDHFPVVAEILIPGNK